MTARIYKVYLYDMRSRKIFAEIETASIQYDYELDAAGSATVSFPLDSLKLDGNKLKPSDIFPVRTGLAIQRGDALVWGGIVWQYKVDLKTNFLRMDASGYFSYYKYRHTSPKGNKFTNKEIIDIIKWFILETNTEAGNGIHTNMTYLERNGTIRSKKWNPYEYVSIADVIVDLSDEVTSYDPVEAKKKGDGFFFYFEPYFIDSDHIGNRMRNTDSRSPFWNAMTLVQGVNCEFDEISVDGTSLANAAYVVGATTGKKHTTQHYELKNKTFSKEIPNMDVVVSDTSEKKKSNLYWRAKSELSFGKNPVVLPSATTYPNRFSPLNFLPGQLVKVSIDDDFLELSKDGYVITKTSVDVASDGSDRMTLDMVQDELFAEVDASDA